LGLPVISITEGSELGIVKCLVINSLKGAVVAMVIEENNWYKVGAKLLPLTAIIGIGDNAVTIADRTSIIPVSEDNAMVKLLDANVKIIGSKVLTQHGSIQGRVTEYSIDKSGTIDSCEIENSTGEITQIQGQSILTFGKDMMIISDEKEKSSPEKSTQGTIPVATDLQATSVSSIVSDAVTDINNLPTLDGEDDSVKKFNEIQRTYLLGKKATRRIEADNGVLIIDKGDEITKEIIQQAQNAGKFVELSMNI